MLTKDMKKALDFMNSNTPDLQGRFYTLDFISQIFNLDFAKSFAVCASLVNEGYLVWSDPQKTVVLPLDKGINYKDLRYQELMQFLNRSVLVPFAVSVATSVATVYITKLFSLL